jgi:hypothetical protein
MKILFIFINIIIFFNSCGYQPTANFAKKELGEQIYTKVEIYLPEAENTVLIKDALQEALKSRLNVNFTDKKSSDSELYVRIKELKFQPLEFDENGYVIFYRTELILKVRHVKNNNLINTYELLGRYDFKMGENVSISDSIIFDAIKFSAQKAVDNLVPKLAFSNWKKNKKYGEKK